MIYHPWRKAEFSRMKRIGVRIAAEARRIMLQGNRIEGFAEAVQDQREAAG